jgi:hypothetical protein
LIHSEFRNPAQCGTAILSNRLRLGLAAPCSLVLPIRTAPLLSAGHELTNHTNAVAASLGSILACALVFLHGAHAQPGSVDVAYSLRITLQTHGNSGACGVCSHKLSFNACGYCVGCCRERSRRAG